MLLNVIICHCFDLATYTDSFTLNMTKAEFELVTNIELTIKKSTYLSLSIFYLRKILTYEFQYDFIKPNIR